MEFDYKTFIPLLTISLSALIGSIAYLYKVRGEAKKSYRKVLYSLLEIRYALLMSMFDSKEATEKYIEYFIAKLAKKKISVKKEDMPEELFKMMEEHFKEIALTLKTDIEKKLLKPYEEALSQLAIIDPILTYRLSGKEKVEKLFIHSDKYEKDFALYLDTINKDEKFNYNLLSELKEEKNKTTKEVLEIFDRDLKEVAMKCGLIDYFKCLQVMKEGASIENLYEFNELDAVFDRLIINMQSQVL